MEARVKPISEFFDLEYGGKTVGAMFEKFCQVWNNIGFENII